MKVLKTIGFMVGFIILIYVVAFIGNILGDLLGNALNLDTLLGQIILVVIFATVFWNILFFVTMYLSMLIPNKASAIVCLILVILVNSRELFQINHWTTGVLFVVDLVATVLPIIIAISKCSIEDKEKKEEEEKLLREKLKAEIIEEMKSQE